MDYTQLRNRVALWPHMSFSGAVSEKRGAQFEVYITDISGDRVSRMFITHVADAVVASELCTQVTLWLQKINSGRSRNGEIMVVACSGRQQPVKKADTPRCRKKSCGEGEMGDSAKPLKGCVKEK